MLLRKALTTQRTIFVSISRRMPVVSRTTRSSARIAAESKPESNGTPKSAKATGKRKLEAEVTQEVVATPAKRKKSTKAASKNVKAEAEIVPNLDQTATSDALAESSASANEKEDDALVPAVLTFSFEEAKKHLISVDHRFEDLFEKLECKPYQHLETVHPFRALATSILGQQISWLAARSIVHRFRRLYDSSLPEKVGDDPKASVLSFPTPEQVAKTDIPTLKSAGLSTRKAEYIQDLAARFADGRLSTQKLLKATDEELAEMLIQVRGIGRWTVDMFSMFSLRRPNILPVGDLGVQRGMAQWFLALHSPHYNVGISPQKLAGATPAAKASKKSKKESQSSEESTSSTKEATPDISSVPPTTVLEEDTEEIEAPKLPPPFTPSIKKTLGKAAVDPGQEPDPLPEGLTVAVLKSRVGGKKTAKKAILSPQEMEDLTESWKPYRSLGVYYMWSLAEISDSD